jgi:hypothetical protein
MRWYREPLVHFLAIGAVLFIVSAIVGGESEQGGDQPDNVIVVSIEDANRLAALWEMQWRRPPTQIELAGLIRQHVREEVLYREALKLGLDRDDTIIRRRLVQKIEFVSEDLLVDEEPPDSVLVAFFTDNAELFGEPASLSFRHVYFNPDRRGAQVDDEARRVLEELRSNPDDPDYSRHGDRLMLKRRYTDLTEDWLANLFGAEFAAAVFELEPGSWQGPVRSGYGLHLVLVDGRTEARLPAFEEVVDDVHEEYVSRRRREVKDEFYARLRENYEFVIDESLPSAVGEEEPEQRDMSVPEVGTRTTATIGGEGATP